ncbi:MAG: DHHA1 domain-containing protein [Candidatus Jordarchaeaceae archaeon]
MEPKIMKIVAHGDWDGVVGAGLLSRIYDLPIEFPLDLQDLTIENAACVEITPDRVAGLKNSLIIDHHGIQPRHGTDKQGNQWVLEPEYDSVSSLIADHWKLDFPEEWRNALEEVDTANLKSKLGQTLWKAYRVDAKGFPRQQVAEMVKNGNWKKLQEWAETQQAAYRKVEEKTKELLEKSANLTPDTVYFTFQFNDRWERGASKDAMLILEEKNPIVVAIGMNEQMVKSGTIATNKNIDLTRIYQYLRKVGYSSGGHKTVGGFQALESKTLEQALQDLKKAIRQTKNQA